MKVQLKRNFLTSPTTLARKSRKPYTLSDTSKAKIANFPPFVKALNFNDKLNYRVCELYSQGYTSTKVVKAIYEELGFITSTQNVHRIKKSYLKKYQEGGLL